MLLVSVLAGSPATAKNDIRLVVQITIDGLRGDIPGRFEGRLEDGGFQRLMTEGVWYTQNFYRHSTTFTAAGHATLFTGADPSDHGLVANDWFDRSTGKEVYCVGDEAATALPIGDSTPTESGGSRSPKNLKGATWGDQLRIATGGESKVFSVSVKDRGSVLPGGHSGTAYWYNPEAGGFETSDYYLSEYPEWVQSWNEADGALMFRQDSWDLLMDREEYRAIDRDNREEEGTLEFFGKTLPKDFSGLDEETFLNAIRFSPFGDRMTLDFCEQIVSEEGLGEDGTPDLLAISLSCFDYVNHVYGPESLEAEDHFFRLNRMLGEFFDFLVSKVDPNQLLVVLCSDHGFAPIPEYSGQMKIPSGFLLSPFLVKKVNDRLKERLEIDTSLAVAFFPPSLYLHRERIAEVGIDPARVEREAAEILASLPGVTATFTRTELLSGSDSAGGLLGAVQRSFSRERSGDVFLIQDPYWYLYSKRGDFAAMHGSPYRYDRHVPLFFLHPNLETMRVDRAVAPNDIAPTISSILGIGAPPHSSGEILSEVEGRLR